MIDQHPTINLETLTNRLLEVRTETERICSFLEIEDHVVQPMVDVSPPKWHLAHTTWFFEQFILVPHLNGYKVFHPDYAYFFNSYYETVGERVLRPERGFMTRPTVQEILDYRAHVNEGLRQYFVQGISENVVPLLQIGLNHEQQHQELLYTDLKYILGHNPMFPTYRTDLRTSSIKGRSANWLKVEEGLYEIGFEGEGFHFDNEGKRHRVWLDEFKIMDRLVTNGEYLEFIEAGGYSKFEYWLAEGWDWVNQEKEKLRFIGIRSRIAGIITSSQAWRRSILMNP